MDKKKCVCVCVNLRVCVSLGGSFLVAGRREILILLTAPTLFGKWLSNCLGNELFESVFSSR